MGERRTSEASAAQTKQSRRRISHISKACNGCRRRKMKCDGGQPSCAICKVYKEECVYNPEADGRRSTPKAYVAALEERVKVLERMLSSHGLDAGGESKPDTSSSDKETAPVSSGGDRLKLDEATGELHELGPTSVFKHTPDDGSAQGSPAASSAAEKPALLYPQKKIIPEFSCPELDGPTHEKVLKIFFDYFNPQCFWVDERKFRRDMNITPQLEGTIVRPIRTAHYSPLLHNIILAVGVGFLEIDSGLREQMGIAFSKRAKDLLEEEAETAMLSTVSGALLLGTYHASVARHNLGFMYSGIGLRLVQALGLGTNCSYWVKNGSITEETKRARYTLFYASYILDKLWSTYVGRGASICIANYDIPVPEPDPEEDEVLWKPPTSRRPKGEFDPRVGQAALDLSDAIATPSEPIKSYRSTTWVWNCKLAILAERVLGTVYGNGFSTSSSNVQHVVSNLDVSLEKWHETLPAELRLPNTTRHDLRVVPSHILGLHAFHAFILILLHRPWFNQLEGEANQSAGSSVSKCERAATRVLQILALFRRCPGLRYSQITMGQVAFSAGTVHLLSAANSSKGSRKYKSSIEGVQQCVQALKEMGQSMQCAAVSSVTLQKLLDEVHDPPPQQLPKPPTPPTGNGLDVAKMLKDPTVAAQLLKMGWAPPTSGLSGQATQPNSQGYTTTPPTVTPTVATAHMHQNLGMDWTLFGPLQGAGIAPLTGVPAPQMGHAHNAGASSSTADPNMLGHPSSLPASGNSIYDVLYSGASSTAFPTGNSWSWPFGLDGEGDDQNLHANTFFISK